MKFSNYTQTNKFTTIYLVGEPDDSCANEVGIAVGVTALVVLIFVTLITTTVLYCLLRYEIQ